MASRALPHAATFRQRNLPFLVLSYGFLSGWGVASIYVPEMNALWLGISTILLAIPLMPALWHQDTIWRLLVLQQFQPGRLLHWLGSRRAVGNILRALFAVFLSATALLQSVFFDWSEWVLLAAAPALFMGVKELTGRRWRPQFAAEAYAQRWILRFTRANLIVLLLLVWLLVRFQLGEPPPMPMGELVHKMQSQWAAAPSGLVRWALDAGAWGHASVQAMGYLSDEPSWRWVLIALLAPVSVLSFASLAFSGFALGRTDFRQIFGDGLVVDQVPPVGALQAGVWSAVAIVSVIVLFSLLGTADSSIDPKASPFAVKLLPHCERIGGVAYEVGTIQQLEGKWKEVSGQLGDSQAATCQKIKQIEDAAAEGVDRYLDWYFSLGADLTRLAKMLTGDIDNFLTAKFEEMVFSSTGVESVVKDVQAEHERQLNLVINGSSKLADLMKQNRLVFNEGQCKVVAELQTDPASAAFETHRARLAGSSVAGLVGGGLAAKAAAKAMGKTSMKTAAKVLAKAVAKKATASVGGAAVGAAIGSVIPGLGTLVGGVIGGIVGGLAVSVAVDVAVLALEEKLTRGDMKNELLIAVRETLHPLKDGFACK